jgi:hypothetical protein
MATNSDLKPDDLAQSLAQSFDIPAESYSGRVNDAIVAMTLLNVYRSLDQRGRDDVLATIRDDMHFGSTNFIFWDKCRIAAVMMIANPYWVPGSLSASELQSEIRVWRDVSYVLNKLGFNGLPTYAGANAKEALSEIRKSLKDPAAKGLGFKAITKPAFTALKPNVFTGATIFGNAARSIADGSLADMQDEARRRGLRGDMSTLDVSRYGSEP